MTQELIALTDELRATRAMLVTLVARLDVADKRARRHRFGTIVLAAVVAAVAVLGIWFYIAERDDDHRTCLTSNEARADIRVAIVEGDRRLLQQFEVPPERYAPELEDLAAFLLETLPDRDC